MPSYMRTCFLNRVLSWGALAVLSSACSSTRGGVPPTPVIPDTTQLVEGPVELVPVVFPHPRWKSTNYQLTTQGITEDRATAIRDSVQVVQHIRIQPAENPTQSSIMLRLMLVTDSTVIPVTPDSGRTYQVDPDGRMLSNSPITRCIRTTSTVSPLYARLLISRYASTWPQTDTLAYDTCIQGVYSEIRGTITWQMPVLAPNRESWIQVVTISGRLSSDSSRLLPLHLRGTLEGSATVLFPADVAQALQLNGTFTFLLNARSAVKQQQVEQMLQLHAIRR